MKPKTTYQKMETRFEESKYAKQMHVSRSCESADKGLADAFAYLKHVLLFNDIRDIKVGSTISPPALVSLRLLGRADILDATLFVNITYLYFVTTLWSVCPITS